MNPRALIRSFSIYTLSNLFNAAMPFLLLPFLTSWLSEEQYGMLALYQVVTTLLIPVVAVGGENVINREYNQEHPKAFRPTWTASHVLTSLIGAGLLVISLIVWLSGAEWLGIPAHWWTVAVSFAWASSLIEKHLTLLRMQHKPLAYGLLRVTRTTMDLGASIWILTQVSQTWTGRAMGEWLAAIIFGGAYLFYHLFKGNFTGQFERKEIIRQAAFGAPLILHTLSAVMVNFADRLVIEEMLGTGSVGVYAVAYQIGLMVHLLQNSFNQAWVPWFFGKLRSISEEVKKQLVQITWLYIFAMALAVAALTAVLPWLVEWFVDPSYTGVEDLVIWIAIGYGLNGVYKMMVNYLVFLGKTKVIGLSTFAAALLNVVLNIWFIQAFGLKGAAMATALTFAFHLAFVWIAAQMAFPMPWLAPFKPNRLPK